MGFDPLRLGIQLIPHKWAIYMFLNKVSNNYPHPQTLTFKQLKSFQKRFGTWGWDNLKNCCTSFGLNPSTPNRGWWRKSIYKWTTIVWHLILKSIKRQKKGAPKIF